jgi:hypothetical protein
VEPGGGATRLAAVHEQPIPRYPDIGGVQSGPGSIGVGVAIGIGRVQPAQRDLIGFGIGIEKT